jgi:plasmid stabilization system protein ParE
MARVQVTTRALADLERLFDFLAEHNPKLARERMASVRRAFELLADHPLLGREAEVGRRELILSRAAGVDPVSWQVRSRYDGELNFRKRS